MIAAVVDVPGDAPSRPAMALLDDLHALAGLSQTALPYGRMKEYSDFSIDL
ncbi:hypothetical protein SRABI123_01171 [Pseudomonas sp. Bi123]|jgi:hypothetical protein|uniref:hypothetical protein n=1 Tax=Pseudomonas sp. Bi123 TaxID=2821121 RepID=UPI001DA7A5D0|nr:hypothetical protein [Pseudomonas sp. Bi123]CAH0170075.1 hypothetical protein SRABI123_01171 [Pseudomonas sp. Bi123]